MTEYYKSQPVPTKTPINDGRFGYFHTVEAWKDAVDADYIERWLSHGDYEVLDGQRYGCRVCGLIAWEPFLHNQWHDREYEVEE